MTPPRRRMGALGCFGRIPSAPGIGVKMLLKTANAAIVSVVENQHRVGENQHTVTIITSRLYNACLGRPAKPPGGPTPPGWSSQRRQPPTPPRCSPRLGIEHPQISDPPRDRCEVELGDFDVGCRRLRDSVAVA